MKSYEQGMKHGKAGVGPHVPLADQLRSLLEPLKKMLKIGPRITKEDTGMDQINDELTTHLLKVKRTRNRHFNHVLGAFAVVATHAPLRGAF